jgi:hypothetical protein
LGREYKFYWGKNMNCKYWGKRGGYKLYRGKNMRCQHWGENIDGQYWGKNI